MYGPHQESVAMLLTSGPSATVSAGKSSTLATVAIFGLKPCCDACFQKVLKSGGSGQLLKTSACLLLNSEIIEVKSVVSVGIRAAVDHLVAGRLDQRLEPARKALPSESFGYWQRDDLVGMNPVPHRREAALELLQAEEEHVHVLEVCRRLERVAAQARVPGLPRHDRGQARRALPSGTRPRPGWWSRA